MVNDFVELLTVRGYKGVESSQVLDLIKTDSSWYFICKGADCSFIISSYDEQNGFRDEPYLITHFITEAKSFFDIVKTVAQYSKTPV